MLQVTGSPTWRTVVGGSATYVERLAARLPDVRRGCAVTSVTRHDDGVDVRTADDQVATLRPRRPGHPRRPGAEPARRRRPAGEGRPRRDHLLGQRDLAAPGLHGAAPPPSGPRVVELPASLRPARRRRERELLDEPAPGTRGRRRPRRDSQPERSRRPGLGHRPDDATPTRSSPTMRSPPRSGCAAPAATGSRSPAPTWAGASTRTAAAPGSRPPRPSEQPGDHDRSSTAACLVVGTVSHTRRTAGAPRVHPSPLPVAGRPRRPASRCRGRPGCWPASTLATTSTEVAWAAASAATSSGSCGTRDVRLDPADRVLMLAHARVLGHTFDPLSVFWCLSPDGTLRAVVLEVHNTYGERHAYLLDVDDDRPRHGGQGLLRLAVQRRLRPVRRPAAAEARPRHHQRRPRPRRRARPDGDDHRHARCPPPARSVARTAARHAFMTQRVSLLIRWHGIRLWLRRLPVQPRPPAPRGERAMTTTTQPIRLNPPVQRPLCLRARVARRIMESVARRVPVDVLLPDGGLLGQGEPATPTGRFSRWSARTHSSNASPTTRRSGSARATSPETGAPHPDTDLAELLLPFAERMTTLAPAGTVPVPAARRPGTARAPAQHPHPGPATTSRRTTTSATTSSRPSSTRRSPTAARSSTTPARGPRRPSRAPSSARSTRSSTWPESRSGSRVLEIGTGWGTLAIEAARRGAHVTTLTLSAEQATLAQARVDAAGLGNLVDIRLQDYREVDGTYDAIVSVEMIEAVGEEFWPTYFEVLDRRLAPGGVAAIQSILMSHDRYRATRNSYGWIQKHIFPGGLIPSLRALDETATRHTHLRVTQVDHFGPHYAETLHRWRTAFTERWPADRRSRLRRDLPPHLGVLPRLLRGRLRLRVPRRRPAPSHPSAGGRRMRPDRPHPIVGRSYWVVGASSGIGAALATELVRRGAHVAISARQAARARQRLGRHDDRRCRSTPPTATPCAVPRRT